jgi:hypothetical protein
VFSIAWDIQFHLLILEVGLIALLISLIHHLKYSILKRLLHQYTILDQEWAIWQETIEAMARGGFIVML